MIQDIAPKKFHIEYTEKTPAGAETALVYSHGLTLLKTDEEGRISFPKVSDLLDTGTTFTYLFRIDEGEYYLARIPEEEGIVLKETGSSARQSRRIWLLQV